MKKKKKIPVTNGTVLSRISGKEDNLECKPKFLEIPYL